MSLVQVLRRVLADYDADDDGLISLAEFVSLAEDVKADDVAALRPGSYTT